MASALSTAGRLHRTRAGVKHGADVLDLHVTERRVVSDADLNPAAPTAGIQASCQAADQAQQRLLQIHPQILAHALGLGFQARQLGQ